MSIITVPLTLHVLMLKNNTRDKGTTTTVFAVFTPGIYR